jgi:DNA-binding NarL/FixJ family response regulator
MKKDLIKVVICDDHSLFREGIKAALKSNDEIVIIGEADNGMRLLQELKHVKPDIILLDINMPVMDGFAVLPKIKKLYPEIKVIVLSWNNDMTWVSSMMNLGANAYLTKDDESQNIVDAIKTCYTREFYMNEITEKGIKNTLQKAKIEDIPVTKFEQVNKEKQEKKVESLTNSPVWKSVARGFLFALIGLIVLAGLYYVWLMMKTNLDLTNFNFM